MTAHKSQPKQGNPNWAKGMVSPNPTGRPKGSLSGRLKALSLLDKMMGNPDNQKILSEALQSEFEKNPCQFYLKFIVPLLPKQSKLSIDGNLKLPVEIRLVNVNVQGTLPVTAERARLNGPTAG